MNEDQINHHSQKTELFEKLEKENIARIEKNRPEVSPIVGDINKIKKELSKHTELLTQIKDELRRLRLKKYPDKREAEK